jgi:hypothetical protein
MKKFIFILSAFFLIVMPAFAGEMTITEEKLSRLERTLVGHQMRINAIEKTLREFGIIITPSPKVKTKNLEDAVVSEERKIDELEMKLRSFIRGEYYGDDSAKEDEMERTETTIIGSGSGSGGGGCIRNHIGPVGMGISNSCGSGGVFIINTTAP